MTILESLPVYLGERTRVEDGKTLATGESGSFVLYWMRTAVRSDENPALDVARLLAVQLDVPLLVYHAISENYQFASDRHHTFMLEGARDVQRQFLEKQISYAFHLASRVDRRPHLATLANRATVVVTEDMPVDPPRRFLRTLKGKTQTPIVCVDTACVAPMQLVKKPYTRAFKFRSATKQIYSERLTRTWPQIAESAMRFDLSKLPFDSLDLQALEISSLIARCDIDHAVGPVIGTFGGSSAGYKRWNRFKESHLKRYEKDRNNALLNGVSRMSPYLHYGMVSPFRLAREAAENDSEGAEKYLDELLIWRELAYVFCYYRDDHDKWSALPEWAQETLTRHAADRRGDVYSWEQLARGETKDDLWNAAQKSLLVQGELHNNVRMTWGKALLNWKPSPHEALATIIDLNHRYALDGRDPASYGGILWCLGQFDRPFEPEKNIFGSVRPRETSTHARRLDPQKYLAKVTKPKFDPIPHVAVVGAGLSGLFAARTLRDHGLKVTVFEKSRGVGGRMSTRRIESGNFDHGAQYFTVRDPRFKRYVESWIEQGVVAKWPNPKLGDDQRVVVIRNGTIQSESNSVDRFVAVPAMNAICNHLAETQVIQFETHVSKVNPTDERIELFSGADRSLGKFDRLIVSAPAQQTAELVNGFPTLVNQISNVEMNPCWAAMVAFSTPVTQRWVGAFLHDSFLSWTARNSTKPERSSTFEHVVIHASSEWTHDHWEEEPSTVAETMLNEFWRATGISCRPYHSLQAHRWKYAIPVNPSASLCFVDESRKVVSCGDWASGSRVEGAFLSGMAAAGRIMGTLSPDSANQELRQGFLFG